MKTLLLLALLSRQASAAERIEAPRAPDVPALPAAAVPSAETASAAQGATAAPGTEAVAVGPSAAGAGPAASAAQDDTSAAESLHLFDGASLQSWERLERTLLDAIGSDAPSRAALWREGVARMRALDSTERHTATLARALAYTHGLDAGRRESVAKLLQAEISLREPLFRRLVETDGRLFALTLEHGVYERKGSEWQQRKIHGGLSFFPSQVSVVGDKLYVADWAGVNALEKNGAWDTIHLQNAQGFAFVGSRLYAANGQGVFFWTGRRWRSAGLSGRKVTALEGSGGRLRARTEDGRSFVSEAAPWPTRLRSLFATGFLDASLSWRLDPEDSAAARAARAGLPPGAMPALSGDERLGFSDSSVFVRSGDAWQETFLATNGSLKVTDAIARGGVVHAATTEGIVSFVPMRVGWTRSIKESFAGLPEGETASFPTIESHDSWSGLAAAMREHLGLAERDFVGAWRAAAAAALRETPDAPLAETLTRALVSTLRREDAAASAQALLSGEPMLGGRVPALSRGDGGLLAAAHDGLWRFTGGSWERPFAAFGLRRVEERDGVIMTAGPLGLHEVRDGADTALFSSSAHDFLPLAPDAWLVAADDGVWRVTRTLNLRLRLQDRKVFRLISHGRAIYAGAEDGFYELPHNAPPRPLMEGVAVRDAVADGDGWILATDQGLYALEGGAARWIPESAGVRFSVLRRSRDGLLALGGHLALIRQDGRWRRAPDYLQGAYDVAEGEALSYVADPDGVRVVPRLKPGLRKALLDELVPFIEKISGEASRAAGGAKAPALRDARGRSLLGP